MEENKENPQPQNDIYTLIGGIILVTATIPLLYFGQGVLFIRPFDGVMFTFFLLFLALAGIGIFLTRYGKQPKNIIHPNLQLSSNKNVTVSLRVLSFLTGISLQVFILKVLQLIASCGSGMSCMGIILAPLILGIILPISYLFLYLGYKYFYKDKIHLALFGGITINFSIALLFNVFFPQNIPYKIYNYPFYTYPLVGALEIIPYLLLGMLFKNIFQSPKTTLSANQVTP